MSEDLKPGERGERPVDAEEEAVMSRAQEELDRAHGRFVGRIRERAQRLKAVKGGDQ